ncbi:MAG TPA: ABC transporter permease [Acidobacteriaceae bacterium]|nr:ABC transporter permease [Acidobacteriaceae bacterium]
MMSNLWTDLRYALQQLRKSPGFAVVAVLTLALGIGATTAIFTLVYDVLLKPLPYAHPGQLVVMQEQVAEFKDIYPTLPMNANHFENWQQHSRSFQSMAVMQPENVPLGTGGHPLQISVLRTTSGIFSVLAVRPQLGRGFTPQEDKPGQERVVILMYGLWKTQFHSDPNILGKTITLDGYPHTVIGVMPQSFHLPSPQTLSGAIASANSHGYAEALVPLAFNKEQLQQLAGDFDYPGLARLKPGISMAQAQAELDGLQHSISAGLSADEKMTLSAILIPFQQYLVGNNSKLLVMLLVAVAGLLFVGCINIMNLLLARAVGRRQEMAVASALGASRRDLLRASMREACVLAAIGGALGILLAAMIVPILQRFLPQALNFRGALHIDWMGAAFAVLLAVIATLLAGAAPAWMSWRTQPQEALRGDSRSASESRGGKRLRKTLVAAEVAVSVTLVLMTGLLTASLYRLMHVDRGFQADRVLTATIELPGKEYPKRVDLYKTMLAKLQQLPGVEHVAIASILPLNGDTWIDMARVPGDTRSFFQMPTEHWRWISPGYFQALHLPLIEGRFLSNDDDGRNDIIVSALTAKTLWPGKDPIGQQVYRGDPEDHKLKPLTVIGVVADARTLTLAKPDPMMIYVPYWYRADMTAGLVVRTKQDPSEMADTIRRTIWSVDPAVAVPNLRTLGGVVADSVATRRFEMDLLLLFAISAWLLAGLGVYGVVTYSVVQRRQEIGLRMALGAQRANIYAQVLREGLTPVFAGAVLGIAVAFAFARVVGSLLFQVDAFNPWIAAAAAASLLLAGTSACLLPARRAASVDPMQALRSE